MTSRLTSRLQSPALQASLATRPLLRPFLRLTETAFYPAGQHGESEPGMSLICLAGACEAMRGAAAMKSLKALAGSSIVIACSATRAVEANQTAQTSPVCPGQSTCPDQPAGRRLAYRSARRNLHTVSHHFNKRQRGFGDLHPGVDARLRTNYTRPVMATARALVRRQGEGYSITPRAAPKTRGQCSAFMALELGWKL